MKAVVEKDWLTLPPTPWRKSITLLLAIVLLSASWVYWDLDATWMSVSGESIFKHQEYWRLWSALLVHGDLGHLLSNSLLFFPLSYLLTSHYGAWFFPLMGLFMGGLTNLIVVFFMPPQVQLVGISGVVYWMAAAWSTLSLLIDERHDLRARMGAAIFLVMILMVPDTYRPEVSYSAHFFGFTLGILSALFYYRLNRKKIAAARVVRYIPEEPSEWYDEAMAELEEQKKWASEEAHFEIKGRGGNAFFEP